MPWHLLAALPAALIVLAALVDTALAARRAWHTLTTERPAR